MRIPLTADSECGQCGGSGVLLAPCGAHWDRELCPCVRAEVRAQAVKELRGQALAAARATLPTLPAIFDQVEEVEREVERLKRGTRLRTMGDVMAHVIEDATKGDDDDA